MAVAADRAPISTTPAARLLRTAELIERHGVVLLLGTVVVTRSNPERMPPVHFRSGYLR
jgi:hypothetical protein